MIFVLRVFFLRQGHEGCLLGTQGWVALQSDWPYRVRQGRLHRGRANRRLLSWWDVKWLLLVLVVKVVPSCLVSSRYYVVLVVFFIIEQPDSCILRCCRMWRWLAHLWTWVAWRNAHRWRVIFKQEIIVFIITVGGRGQRDYFIFTLLPIILFPLFIWATAIIFFLLGVNRSLRILMRIIFTF